MSRNISEDGQSHSYTEQHRSVQRNKGTQSTLNMQRHAAAVSGDFNLESDDWFTSINSFVI